MKTSFLTLFLFLICSSLNAQIIFPTENILLHNELDIQQYIKNTEKEFQSNEINFSLTYFKKSVASKHYTFQILFKNIPLLYASIKVNTNLQDKLISIKKENINIKYLQNINIENELFQWQKININQYANIQYPINNSILKIDTHQETPEIICEINCFQKTYDYTYIVNKEGEILKEWNNSRYVNIDTIIHARVFNPDPITTLGVNYGAPYIDDNDNNLAWFAPAYSLVDFTATYETASNTFSLENSLVKIEDFQSPTAAPATNTNPNFYFDRSESGFEDVNTMYHITKFHNYISSIGYDSLMNEVITIDTHGMLGADNSMFNRNGGNPTLNFGTGGVDDAEDADVIIHEYSHALSWKANNNSNFSTQRSGLDEGLADYFATSYSRAINPYHWDSMFTWDGHNEYWGGRTASTSAVFPNASGIYEYGEIWNAAMSSIWTDLGQIVTDKLMFECMHFFTDNTTLPEAALYVLQSDTALFNGLHSNTICNHFKNKNLLDANCNPVKTIDIEKSTDDIIVKNTFGFAKQNENLEINFLQNENGSICLYNIIGQKIFEQKFENKNKIYLNPNEILKGDYILKIQTSKKIKVIKINK